jgi:hypothetical protein
MKFRNTFFLLAMAMPLLFGFSFFNATRPIDIVKNGYWEMDESTTVGNALDNYSYFLDNGKEWTTFEDQQKRTIVQFVGVFDDMVALPKLIDQLSKQANTKLAQLDPVSRTLTLSQFSNEMKFIINVTQEELLAMLPIEDEIEESPAYKWALRVQFTLLKDNRFQVSYIGYTRFVYEDGAIHFLDEDRIDESLDSLKTHFKNEATMPDHAFNDWATWWKQNRKEQCVKFNLN